MIHRKNVHCGDRYVPPFEINVDTVYVRYNIHAYTDHDNREGMEYDEDSYDIDEYLKLEMAKEQPDIDIVRQLLARKMG